MKTEGLKAEFGFVMSYIVKRAYVEAEREQVKMASRC
jgi:hypothetical protein